MHRFFLLLAALLYGTVNKVFVKTFFWIAVAVNSSPGVEMPLMGVKLQVVNEQCVWTVWT